MGPPFAMLSARCRAGTAFAAVLAVAVVVSGVAAFDGNNPRQMKKGSAPGAHARALTDLDPSLPADDDWSEAWGTSDACAKGGAFAAAVPAFLEHCGPLAVRNTPCTVLCNRAFSVISSYPVCLQEFAFVDMEETPWMRDGDKNGLKPEESLEVIFMMAFSKCHTAQLLPSGPTSPASASSCSSLLMAQFENDVVKPYKESCGTATRSKCTEVCSHYNSVLRRHPCFGRFYHTKRRQRLKNNAESRAMIRTIETTNVGCALTSSKLQMITDMCSEENLLQFQDLTWNSFIRACHASSGAARNPWAAWGDKAKKAHANGANAPPAPRGLVDDVAADVPDTTAAAAVATADAVAAPRALAQQRPKVKARDKLCHASCKRALLQVLADEYCLQRYEDNAALAGDVGAMSLIADALTMCDLTRPPPPPKYAAPTRPRVENDGIVRGGAQHVGGTAAAMVAIAAAAVITTAAAAVAA